MVLSLRRKNNLLMRWRESRAERQASAARAKERHIEHLVNKYAAMLHAGWFAVEEDNLSLFADAEYQYGSPQEEMRGIIGGVSLKRQCWEAWLDVGFLPRIYRGPNRDLAMYRVEEAFKHYKGGEYEILGPDPRVVAAQQEGAESMKSFYDLMMK